MNGYNILVGEPYPETDDSGMLDFVADQSPMYEQYPTAASDGTHFTVAGILIIAGGLLVALRLAGFRGMVAVHAGR